MAHRLAKFALRQVGFRSWLEEALDFLADLFVLESPFVLQSTWVTHSGIALVVISLNFEVLMEPEASELPKGLVLGRDESIHLRLT
ncbi:hypothetical protein DVH24_002049 [Malus domestica]|uniref:Uncharacterized protein n=1 Tax=Malus domestica TaxID=3750 RepID=A0A498IAG6_MALDO|nr:hypothetical protein DVH24_002049 [Malus domestica]